MPIATAQSTILQAGDPLLGNLSLSADLRVQLDEIQLIHISFPQLVLGTLGGSLLLGALIWGFSDPRLVVAWVAAVWLLAGLRTLLYLRHRRLLSDPQTFRRVIAEMAASAALAGAAWGLGGVVFFDPDRFITAAVLCLILGGMISGSVAIYAAVPAIYQAFALPAVLPFIVAAVMTGQSANVAAGLALLVFGIIQLGAVQHTHKVIREVLTLRAANLQLISDLERERNVAVTANLSKSKLFAAASHDLRQPLHALGLLLATLQRRAAGLDKDLFNSLRTAQQALVSRFDRIMDMSALEAGAIVPQFQRVDVNEIVRETCRELGLEGHHPILRRDLSPTPALVESDPVLLYRIIQNVLMNAIKHAGGVSVSSAVDSDGGTVRLTFSDTGPGIDEALLPLLFQPFVQSTPPGYNRGAGLGLYIVKQLSQLLAIRLEVVNRPGKGTSFVFSIPVVAPRDGHPSPQFWDAPPAADPDPQA